MFLTEKKNRFSPGFFLSDRWIGSPWGRVYIRFYHLEPGILQWVSGTPEEIPIFLWGVAEIAFKKGWRTFPSWQKGSGLFSLIWKFFQSSFSPPRPFSVRPENWNEVMKAFEKDADLYFFDGTLYLQKDFPYRGSLNDLLVREVLQRGRSVIFFSFRPPYDECPWDERYLMERGVLHPVAEELRSLPFSP